jgi:hypothetical protein
MELLKNTADNHAFNRRQLSDAPYAVALGLPTSAATVVTVSYFDSFCDTHGREIDQSLRWVPPLPQEIIHLILDVLREEVETLECCALVCRAWLRPSRAHLFRNLHIHEESQYNRLIALFDSCPELQTTVRNIDVSLTNDSLDVTPSIPHRALTELAPRLPNLHELQLSDLTWSSTDAQTLRLPRLSSSLTSLALTRFTFPSCPTFVALLNVAPGLRCLDVAWLMCTFPAEDATAAEAPLELDMLTMRGLSRNMDAVAAQALAKLLRPRKLVWWPRKAVDDIFLDVMCEHSGSVITDFHAIVRNSSRFPLIFHSAPETPA